MWKLIAAGVVVLALMGAVVSFIHGQREIGRADERAKQAEAKAELEKDLADAAEMAREDAVNALAKATKRQTETRQALVATELSRQAANEVLARTNAKYAQWSAELLPDPVPDRLQQHIALVFSAVPPDRVVPGRPDLQARPLQSAAESQIKR